MKPPRPGMTPQRIKRIVVTWIAVTAGVLDASAPQARAQCAFEWKPGEGLPGLNGVVYAATVWDPDAEGPQAPLLVVGGLFTIAGNVLANNIAAWNGTAWSALGTGMNGDVNALTVYNGNLIAGGNFTTAGGISASYIALWNGNSWSPLGTGMSGIVQALTVFNGNLMAGGGFTTAGSASANRIAQWNGTAWSALGTGMNGSVFALTVYNGNLIAGGGFTTAGGGSASYIAQWDGASWSALGAGMGTMGGPSPFVHALTVYNGNLIAGGAFTTAGGNTANRIAQWNGASWSALGSGMNGEVRALTVYNSNLIAGGVFTIAGSGSANSIAQWNGSSWTALGSGTGGNVRALTVFNGNLIAAGGFTNAGGVLAHRVAQWNGASWSALGSGMNNYVNALTVYNGNLIAGGAFTTAGDVSALRIAQRNGASWSALGSGINGEVFALTVYNGNLIAGGNFTTAGGNAANRIAQWNGSSWSALGTGMDSHVYALTVYNGNLIAGGQFTTAGGVSALRIAQWNGSSWSALGTGMNNLVAALTVYNGNLIAGGWFTAAGGVSAFRIAQWNGSSWSALGTGMNDSVLALTVHNGNLIAGGWFTTAGGGSANYIGQWNGSSWSALGSFAMNNFVESLAVYNGNLIAGGSFTTAGFVSADGIAQWHGNSWSALGSGLLAPPSSGRARAVTMYKNELYAGGAFTTAGGNPSAYWARWGPTNNNTTDSDGDGILDICDNCLCTPNPGQEDTNANSVGDVCEAPPPPRLYVNASAGGANDGTSWDDAFTKLQPALCVAASVGSVEEIWVAAGIYRPDEDLVNTNGTDDRTATFQLIDGVTLNGGFAGDEISLLQRDPGANPTILSGDLLGNDDEFEFPDGPTYADNAYHVVTGTGADDTATLDGFTITGGYDPRPHPNGYGGGMLVDSTASPGRPVVRNCTFTLNFAGVRGGGLSYDVPPTGTKIISNCTFHNNAAFEGGAIAVSASGFPRPLSPLVTDCVFTENSATFSGGAAHSRSAHAVYLNCHFDDNVAFGTFLSPGGGGAIGAGNSGIGFSLFNCTFRRNTAGPYGYGGALSLDIDNEFNPPTNLVGCTFVANSAPVGGAAFLAWSGGPPNNVINCTFTANAASTGGGIYNVGAGYNVINSLFWVNRDSGGMGESAQIYAEGGGLTVNHCLVQGGWSGAGSGNVNADPLFVRDPDSGPDGLWNGINDDFGDLRLAAGSPAIDSGNNTLTVADAVDLDCDGNPLEAVPQDIDGGPRFVDDAGTADTGVAGNGYTEIVDMGAHEAGAASLDRLYVSASATGQNNGANWADAHVELRDALDIVAANECFAVEIWVAADTYRPAPPGGSRDATFQLVDGVAILGGFVGNETSSDGRNPALNVTVLSGDLAGNDTGGPGDPSLGENSYRVLTGTGTGPTAVLDGFTVTGGNAESPRTGGGLLTLAGGPTLRDCIITGNVASCSEQLDSSGGVLTAEGLTLDLAAGGAGFDQSIIDVQGTLTAQNGEFDVFGTTLTGPGTLQLASGATMNVRNTSPCGAQTATRSAGPVAATGIYQPQLAGPPAVPARWEINGNLLSDVVISGPTRTWVIAPTGLSAPATLTWTGNFIEEDRSSGGRAEALLHEHGALTVSGTVYEGANPLFTGTLLTARVSEFHVQESATTANLLSFVQPPVLILTGGYLVENDQGLILAGNQTLTLTGASVQQDGGAWSTFATSSTLALSGPAQLGLEPANPPQTAMIVRSAIRGTGDIDIELGGALILEEQASLNLSGLPDDVCATTDVPGAPPGGTVSVNGSLIVRDTARVHNTQVDVNLADFGDGSAIVHNDISLVEGSTGFGGEFFASGSATMSCNRVTAFGDRILDLDPDPDDGEAPILVNNQFFVIISQGVDLEQGELFELRATDHDCADTNGCASGAFQLAASAGYDDTWTLEELEVLPGAKVNLTNRAGFDFAPADPVPETVYVKNLVLGDSAVLNTGLQRLYYQNLTLGAGAQMPDIPMLGFSLKIIAMEDDVEFDVRVRTRLRDPADDPQPVTPPFKEGAIARVEGLIPAASSNGVMDMRTQADDQLSASSVAARGSFARAGEDEIVVAFEYLFVENPAAELIVYLGDAPDPAPAGCTTNGCCDDERCEVARLYAPPAGRDGSATSLGGSGQLATFYGRFPRGNLNFHRGTYVELELRGTSARVWIDDWDPRIRCSGCADLNGTGGPEGEDYLLLLASFGLDIDANMHVETGEQENADCFDSVLGGDRYVDTGDLLAWDTFLDEDALNACGTGVRGSQKSEVGSRNLLVRESILEPRFGGFLSHAQFGGTDSPTETPEIGISGPRGVPSPTPEGWGTRGTASSVLIVAGKPNGAGLQDDYLYPIDTDGACPGGSPLPAAAGPGTRGHGRLVPAPDGTLYQLHATGGVLPVESGPALVEPATNLTPTSNSSLRVTVGVNDFGGGEFLGLPIADAAFHPTDANVLYVVPVLVIPLTGLPPCDRYKAAAKLVLSGGNYTVERLYEVPAANRTPPCDFPPQLDQGEFREIEVSTDGSKVFIASARADNDNDWLLVFNESSGTLATSALVGEVPPEGMMPAGLTVAAPLAMLASRTGGTPYLYLAAGVNAAPSETVGEQSVARTRVFRFDVSSGIVFAGALDISNPECVNPYDTLGCTSTLTALAENPNDGTLYALGFVAPRFNVDYPYNSPPFGGPNSNQIVIFTTPTVANILAGATWSMTVPPPPPAAAAAVANRVTCADLALPISLARNAAGCGVAGDMDGDGDVQLDDWADFAGCLTGPTVTLGGGCDCADVDADEDADLADVAGFQNNLGP